jgi:hypothetical protein
VREELERAEDWVSRASNARRLVSNLAEEATAVFREPPDHHPVAPSDPPIR